MARNSKIIFAKGIKMDREYLNVIDYTESDLLTLLRSQTHLVLELNDCSFIRENETIFADITYENALKSNYIAFQNPDYSNKWFFAWIDEIKYVGEKNVEIKYTVDSWSTFFKSLTLRQCMVIREHINPTDDVAGANTVPENLDLGNEYKINAHLRDSFNREVETGSDIAPYYIVVASTKDLNTLQNVNGALYNGIPSGIKYFYYQIDYNPIQGSPIQDFIDALNRLASSSIGGNNPLDAITSVFIAPYWLLKGSTSSSEVIQTGVAKVKHTGISKISALDGYTPINKKLLTWPYCYILLSNCQGSDAILKQELWGTTDVVINNDNDEPSVPIGDMVLDIWGALTPGCSIRAVPWNYNGDDVASNYGINLGKFPQINWNSDAFINWLTQNGVNIAMASAGTAIGLATSNPVIASNSISKGVDLLMGGVQASMSPPQNHGNTNNGDIMLSMDENCFHIYRMSIKNEYAERIDKFFTKYGYKTNKLKIPNVTGRPIFNYIQISGDDDIGFGSFPSKYLESINKACRNGVTIWHNHANIGDYTLNNTIAQ